MAEGLTVVIRVLAEAFSKVSSPKAITVGHRRLSIAAVPTCAASKMLSGDWPYTGNMISWIANW